MEGERPLELADLPDEFFDDLDDSARELLLARLFPWRAGLFPVTPVPTVSEANPFLTRSQVVQLLLEKEAEDAARLSSIQQLIDPSGRPIQLAAATNDLAAIGQMTAGSAHAAPSDSTGTVQEVTINGRTIFHVYHYPIGFFGLAFGASSVQYLGSFSAKSDDYAAVEEARQLAENAARLGAIASAAATAEVTVEIAAGFNPIASAAEAATGQDMRGNPLSPGQRLMAGINAVPGDVIGPAVGKLGEVAADAVKGADEAEKAIPEATRLREVEQGTASRLLQAKPGLKLTESSHIGSEYVDQFGKTYDAVGSPAASKFWNQEKFLSAIDEHLLKSNDFTVVDLTGFTKEQIEIIRNYIDSLPATSQAKIIRIGF